MKDYLIVGAGLAGLAFAEVALRHGKEIRIVDNGSQGASSVAAGLYNPVAIKRLKPIPKAHSLLDTMLQFYGNSVPAFLHPLPLLRKFHSYEEQNQWFEAADSPALRNLLHDRLVRLDQIPIDAPFGYGEVRHTGYVDTKGFINSYREDLAQKGLYDRAGIDYSLISIETDACHYEGEAYKQIVFAEGFGLRANPYFNHLPLNGTKGEILLIRAEGLHLKCIVNAGIFILPVGKDVYRVGATYEHLDKTNVPTEAGRQELLEKLRSVLQCNFEVIGHEAGVRPTVRDRQPLLGRHPQWSRLAVINGLGTRGVLFAPSLAEALFQHIEHETSLPMEWDIARFRRGLSHNGQKG